MSIYTILKGMVREDIPDDFSEEDVDDIGNVVDKYLKKTLTDEEYSKVHKYIMDNKDEEEIKDYVLDALDILDLHDLSNEDAPTILDEKIKFYRLTIKLKEKLEKVDYDPIWAKLKGINEDSY